MSLGAVGVSTAVVAKFLGMVSHLKEEFLADYSFLRKLFGAFLSEEVAKEQAESKNFLETYASEMTKNERSALLQFVVEQAMDNQLPKFLRVLLLHSIRDVTSPAALVSVHKIFNELLTGHKSLTYFECASLQILISSLLRPEVVSLFNDTSSNNYFASVIQAMRMSDSYSFKNHPHSDIVTKRDSHLSFMSDFYAPRLAVLGTLTEKNGFIFMGGLSLANKSSLFMTFMDILLESYHATETEETVINQEAYHKPYDTVVVESGKNMVKRILRSMNLSCELSLAILQAQLQAAQEKFGSSDNTELKEGDDAAQVGKKSKSRHRGYAEDSSKTKQSVKKQKKFKISPTESDKEIGSASQLNEQSETLLVMQRLNMALEILLTQIPHLSDKQTLLKPLVKLLDIMVQSQKREGAPEEGKQINMH